MNSAVEARVRILMRYVVCWLIYYASQCGWSYGAEFVGCQHAQVSILRAEIEKRDPHFDKPLYIFEHQQEGTEDLLMQKALKATFCGLVFANSQVRQPAPLSKPCIGLECGGSDGFSGISANPAVGLVSDIVKRL